MSEQKVMYDFAQARYLLMHRVNAAFAESLKTLLETKHLYQSVAFDIDLIVADLAKNIPSSNDNFVFRKFAQEFNRDLEIAERQVFAKPGGVPNGYAEATLVVQNVKLFCSRCKARETFSPTLYFDASDAVHQKLNEHPRTARHPAEFQILTLLFQCETCRDLPVAFLVKRFKWKLWLEGRSPIEEVDLPAFLPKPERKLFSDAVVAAQTGNGLAGVFYLRCFIEQFARRQTGIQERKPGEDIVGDYQSLIPEKQREQMPSLRHWYEKLSVPIHTAKADDELFEQAKAEVLTHFDFRRLFKIEDRNPENYAPKNGGGD